LNLRATEAEPAEAIADFIQAQRTRRSVLAICQRWLESKREPGDEEELKSIAKERYWVLATMAEAWLGLGDENKSEEYMQQAAALDAPKFRTMAGVSWPAPADWMISATQDQLASLKKLLDLPALKKLQ